MIREPQTRYRQFLLGLAGEEEQLAVEEAILAGEVGSAFLRDMEDELIDEYLLETITPVEIAGFWQHFLAVRDRRERVAFAATLIQYAQKQTLVAPVRDEQVGQTTERGVVSAIFWRRAALLATAASLLLALWLGFATMQVRRDSQVAIKGSAPARRSGPVSHVVSESDAQDTSSLQSLTSQTVAERMPTIAFLAPTRGAFPIRVEISDQAQFVRIDKNLDAPLAKTYRETILAASGEQLWAQEFSPSIFKSARRSSIVVPASILPPGLYRFEIARGLPDGTFSYPEGQNFKVARR